MKIILTFLLAFSLMGAKSPTTVCTLTPTDTQFLYALYITGLPTNDEFSYTRIFYPIGTTLRTDDGTWTSLINMNPGETLYVWERGGGKSLEKPGKGLNDYHLIATCIAP